MAGIEFRIKLRCKRHPKYKGIRPFKEGCNNCEAIWTARHDPEYFAGKYVFDRKTCWIEMEILDEPKEFEKKVNVWQKITGR